MNRQTEVVKVVILAGGFGTRSANPTIPKLLQELSHGCTLLDHWVRTLSSQGFRDIIISGGHGFENLEYYINDLDLSAKIALHRDHKLEGTASAVRSLPIDWNGRALVLFGDTFSALNYKHLLNQWLSTNSDFGVFIHRNNHLEDSDTLEVPNGERVHFRRKGDPIDSILNQFAITGGFFANLSALAKALDQEMKRDVIEAIFEFDERSVIALPVAGISMDTGTPDRLRKARCAWQGMNSPSLPSAVFIDRDNTLIPDAPEGWRELPDGLILERDAEAIGRFNRLGVPVFVVTNQPAVAKGWITEGDVAHVHGAIQRQLAQHGAWIDEFASCFHYPVDGFTGEIRSLKHVCKCRKPSSGLAEDLMQKYGLSKQRILVVGDSSADEGLAKNLGALFEKVDYRNGPRLGESLERHLIDCNS